MRDEQNVPTLRVGRMHEAACALPGDPAARVFAAWVAGRRKGTCLWVLDARTAAPCPHGLCGLMDPATIIFARVNGAAEDLWTAEQALRSGAVATMVMERSRPLDLLQSRRLQLAAEAGDSVGLVLCPCGTNTAAETRWRCTPLRLHQVRGGRRPDSRETVLRWEQLKNKKGSLESWDMRRDETTGHMRVAAAPASGTGTETRRRQGDAAGCGRASEERLAGFLAEHAGALSRTHTGHDTG